MIIQDAELLYNDQTGRYTIYQPVSGMTKQTSRNAAYDMQWLGLPKKSFNNRTEVEAYIRSCKVSLLAGSTKELGIPK